MANLIRVTELPGAKEPSVALDDTGRMHVAFGVSDMLYLASESPRSGAFAPPVKIAQAGHLALGMRRGPRLVALGKTLVVSAIYGQQGGGRDGELLAWRSNDGGATWSGPATVNDIPGATREGLHAMAVASDGTLACAWLDLREKGTTVFASTSRDGGKTWSRNTCVYRSPAGTVCECCHVSLGFTPKNALLVIFRNVLQGNRDMYLCYSQDRGRTFSAAQKLGVGFWPLNACPMDGGMIAISARGAIQSIWRREGTVYTCLPGHKEQALEVGQQPWNVAGKDGFWSAWLVGRPGKLRVQSPTGVITTLAEGANDPVLCAKKGTVSLAWTGPDGIWASRLT
ncbi:MAG: exo-alpha-sialidase [Armatimonas sp.]